MTPIKRYRNELVCTKTITLLAEVAAYSSFYAPSDYPITKVLREPVYVEVRILARSDPNIILNLEHCWATSNPNPDSLPQWDLLFNGYIKAIWYNFVHIFVFCAKVDSSWLQVSVPWWQIPDHSGSCGRLLWASVPDAPQTFCHKDVHICGSKWLLPTERQGTATLFKLGSLHRNGFLDQMYFCFFF